MEQQKCLVTGGAGFIGSHLVDRLLADGHTVIAIDNFSGGGTRNLLQHLGHPQFTLVEGDVNDRSLLTGHMRGVQWVFHLAALVDIVPSMEDPSSYHTANVSGTQSVLEVARKSQVERFVFAASSSCYGIPDVFPTPETASIRPMYPYALTKYLGEEYVLSYARIYGLPTVSLRFFNVYGPRSRTSKNYGAMFGVFLTQKLNGQPYTVVGDGQQSRDFTYVTDAVDALVCAAQSDLTATVMNVGSGAPSSVNQIVQLLGGETTYIPKRPGEPDMTFADIRRIQKLLGWAPKVSLETGVKNLLSNLSYWAEAPLWTPDSIAKATGEWFKYLGRTEVAARELP